MASVFIWFPARYQVSLPVFVNNAYKHPWEIRLLFCEHLRDTKWQETTERWGLNYDNKIIIWVWDGTDTIQLFISRISYLVKITSRLLYDTLFQRLGY